MNVKHEEKMTKGQNICREINACGKEERKKIKFYQEKLQ